MFATSLDDVIRRSNLDVEWVKKTLASLEELERLGLIPKNPNYWIPDLQEGARQARQWSEENRRRAREHMRERAAGAKRVVSTAKYP